MNWVRLFLAIFLSWFAYVRTDGFIPSRITADLLSGKDLPSDPISPQILSQPFHYLGRGRQCFVFESEDQNYVLKFFNRTYFKTHWYMGLKERQKREKRRKFYESSYEIAYRHFQDEILYLHQHPTEEKLPLLKIKDKASGEYEIELSKTPFVLQRKGVPISIYLKEVLAKEGKEGVQREMDHYLTLVKQRIEANIADGDSDIRHNWGYLNGKLFQLDPGRLYYDETLLDPRRQEQELEHSTRNFSLQSGA